jgi:hypothetical protein
VTDLSIFHTSMQGHHMGGSGLRTLGRYWVTLIILVCYLSIHKDSGKRGFIDVLDVEVTLQKQY